MQVYLVLAEDDTPAADSLFLRDGFSLWAFLLTPFWLLYHRLWWPFLAFVLAVAGVFLLDVGTDGTLLLIVALKLFFGLEGQDMRATQLAKRGYRERAIVAGDELDDAELRYYADRPADPAPLKPPPLPDTTQGSPL